MLKYEASHIEILHSIQNDNTAYNSNIILSSPQ
jgi:hypothetical protein